MSGLVRNTDCWFVLKCIVAQGGITLVTGDNGLNYCSCSGVQSTSFLWSAFSIFITFILTTFVL